MHVEDHPMDYGEFEGVIPKGQYGAGTVLLWDRGTWEPFHDPVRDYQAGKLHFVLNGQKLRGEWALVRMHGDAGGKEGNNWLLMKSHDRFASFDRNILEESPESVKRRSRPSPARRSPSGTAIERTREVAPDNGRGSTMPERVIPQLAVLSDHPPKGDDWLHDAKFDGYRLLAFVRAGNVRMSRRLGPDRATRFPALAEAPSHRCLWAALRR